MSHNIMVLDNPQMPMMSPEREDRKVTFSAKKMRLASFGVSESFDSAYGVPRFRIGVVIHQTSKTEDKHIASISKPASSCLFSNLVVMDTQERGSISPWLQRNSVNENETAIGWGEDGFQELLQDDVDAVYIIVPVELQTEFSMRALKAGKHVLLNDPVSTGLADFKEQQECAKSHGKFIQFSTMFVHQHNVLRFIDSVANDEGFDQILKIDCFVRLSYKDVEKVGLKLPLGNGPNEGIIRVLGRFCVIVSALFFSRVGVFAHSAKVTSARLGENGELLWAKCTVKFADGRQLNFDVGYTHNSATRQQIELQAKTRIASMKDFIIEHPDRLATYRVYDKAPSSSGQMEIVSGEAIDVAGGPPEEMMMWRRFADLSKKLEPLGWDHSEKTAECRELANVALQTKRILIALMKSLENSYEEVIIDDIDYQ